MSRFEQLQAQFNKLSGHPITVEWICDDYTVDNFVRFAKSVNQELSDYRIGVCSNIRPLINEIAELESVVGYVREAYCMFMKMISTYINEIMRICKNALLSKEYEDGVEQIIEGIGKLERSVASHREDMNSEINRCILMSTSDCLDELDIIYKKK